MTKRKNSELGDGDDADIKKAKLWSEERNVLKYRYFPSLQCICGATIAVKLWKREEIPSKIYDCELYYQNNYYYAWENNKTDSFRRIEDQLVESASEEKLTNGLPIPDEDLDFLRDMIKAVGLEFVNWLGFHDSVFGTFEYTTSARFIDCIQWTCTGRINYLKSVRNLLDSEKVKIGLKYRLACVYCLEEDVKKFAKKASETAVYTPFGGYHSFMLRYWCSKGTGHLQHLQKPIQLYESLYKGGSPSENLVLLHYSINDYNQVAARYACSKVSEAEILSKLELTLIEHRNAPILAGILSQLSFDAQFRIFKNFYERILWVFLNDLLCVEFFLDTFRHTVEFSSPDKFYGELRRIDETFLNTSHKGNPQYGRYEYVVTKMWESCPLSFRSYVFEPAPLSIMDPITRPTEPRFAKDLLPNIDYEKAIRLLKCLLSDANEEQKRLILFSMTSMDKCRRLLSKGRWDILAQLVQITLLSDEDKNRFKELLIRHVRLCTMHLLRAAEISETENFLKWAFVSERERKIFKTGLEEKFPALAIDILKTKNVPDADKFLDWAFATQEEKQTFKETLGRNHLRPCAMFLLKTREITHVKEIFEWAFPSRDDREQFKADLARDFRGCAIELLDAQRLPHLENFLEWAFPEPAEREKFKRGELCLKYFFLLIRKFRFRFEGLDVLDNFLLWCFKDEELAQDFKLAPETKRMLSRVMRLAGVEADSIRHFLRWYFKDESLVESFKITYNSDRRLFM